MNARTLVAALVALSATACIDLEGAYASCVDAGRCSDAGTPEQPVVVDSGTPDAGPAPYDGGASCGGSSHRRLRCDAPITLGTGSAIRGSSLAASNNGFIAGWVGSTLELREVHLDGSTTSLLTGVPVSGAQFTVDARESYWAATWVDSGGLKCVTSRSSTQINVALADGGGLDLPTVAISKAGAVALSGTNNDHLFGASSASGCPSTLTQLAPGFVNSVGVVATTASADDDGFRYVWTDQINAYNGSVNIMQVQRDGGTNTASTASNLRAPGALAVASSMSGDDVLIAYAAVKTDDTYELNAWGTPASLAGTGAAQNVATFNPGWWTAGACGPNCLAAGVIAFETPGPATVTFFDADTATKRSSWDVACGLPAQMNDGSSISIATFGGRLGVLLTAAANARLYLCDVPPNP